MQIVGDASGAAGAFGVEPGMRVAEALARCPSLVLVPPDPQRATERWESALAKLEGVGAAVESSIRGEVFFGLDGLRVVLGSPERSLEHIRAVLGGPVRLGAGPTRLCALAAALRAKRRRRSLIVTGAEANMLLRSLPIAVLRDRMGDVGESASLVETLERLGLRTLGQLADLPDAAVADRFGPPGLRAQRLARGEEEPLRPRPAPQALRVGIELPEASAGGQLQRALEILLDRLLADRRRENRAIRRMRLEAQTGCGRRLDRRGRASQRQRQPRPTAAGTAPEAGGPPRSRLAPLARARSSWATPLPSSARSIATPASAGGA